MDVKTAPHLVPKMITLSQMVTVYLIQQGLMDIYENRILFLEILKAAWSSDTTYLLPPGSEWMKALEDLLAAEKIELAYDLNQI